MVCSVANQRTSDTMPIKDLEERRKYQREWQARRRQKWLQENGPCVDCGSWRRLEVDHVDPSTKITHGVWSWSEKRRLEELKKCVVRCYRCHKLKTAEENRKRFARPIAHGTISAYTHKGCRCSVCSAYYKTWRHRKYVRVGN